MGYYSDEELKGLGFAKLGSSVLVSRKASLYGISRMSIGDYSRIDDFSVISAGEGGIDIGCYVHIAVMCSLMGQAKIEMEDFSGLSSRVCVYSSSDDYSGIAMTNPTVPKEYTKVDTRPVRIGKHVIIGAGSVVLPGTIIEDGAAVGALSLVRGVLESFVMYSGVPAKAIKPRKRDLLELENQLKQR